MRLRILLDQSLRAEHDASPDVELAGVEVDVGTPQRHELAAASAGRSGDDQQHREGRVVGLGDGEETGEVVGRRRSEVALRHPRWAGVGDDVAGDPAPLHALADRPSQDAVDAADRRWSERVAGLACRKPP